MSDPEPGFMRSQVARRVFLLFVLAAVAPVAVTVLLSFGHLSNLLQRLGHDELSHTGKSYVMTVLERLSALETVTADLAAGIAAGRALPEVLRTIARQGIRHAEVARAAHLDAGALTAAARRRLEAGAAVIDVLRAGAGVPRVRMIRAVDPARPELGMLIAEPKPSFLWGEPDTLPVQTDVCVLDQDGRALHCTGALPKTTRAAAVRAAGGASRLAWKEAEQKFVGNASALALERRFAAPDWTVVVSRPEAALLAPLDTFWTVLMPAIVVSLLLVVLLTVVQVRRRLVPLELLADATRRIGNKDFTTPATVRSGDEFEELADAINSMAVSLERQFSIQATWSEIDRVILAEPNIDHVLEIVLSRLPDIVPADLFSVTILEDPKRGLGRTYARTADVHARLSVERTALSAADTAALTALRQGRVLRTDDKGAVFLVALGQLGATSVYVLPVMSKGWPVGVICLGFLGDPRLSEDERSHVHALADRVAVALSAAEREEQLYHQAHHDSLTGLPNRLFLRDRLEQELSHAHREGRRLALLFVDLDRFKDVNDTLGHAAGDHLLRVAAMRLRGCVRETDTVVRLAGDEFTILLSNISSPRDAQIVAENAINVLSEPVVVEARETFMSCSIGVTLYPEDGSSGEELLRNADTAMYRAKQNGSGRYLFFEEQMNVEAVARMELEQDLRRALERDEFVLHFQPQAELASGETIGAEMLVRWAHPSRGLLPPAQFIPVAESAGLIEALGEQLLYRACAQFSQWRAEGIAPQRLAVNVSSRQFRQARFWESVHKVLAAANMSAERLELEITESLLLDDAPEVMANFSRLQAMGVRMAIDDFGMGYSSLGYLKRLPIHAVKIDRAFIRDVPGSEDAATLVHTIIAMAHTLHKDVTAEGVETAEQLNFLRAHHCHLVQGFAISPPLSAEVFSAYMRSERRRESRRRAGENAG